MMKNIAKALTPVAAAFGAATIALTPANDANAQSAAATASSDFSIGRAISVSQYQRIAEQHNQLSLAKFNFMSVAANGSGQLNAGYITVNPTTGRGWLMKGDAELGKATSVTPIMELTNVVMFNPYVPGSGINNLTRASPTVDYQQAPADCARWSRQMNMSFDDASLYSCESKTAYYNRMISRQDTVAVVGQVVNGSPLDANIFTLSLHNIGESEQTGVLMRMGANAYMTQHFIINYEIYPSVHNDIVRNQGLLAGYIGTQSQLHQPQR